jgi:hypothetical protein
LPDDWSPPAISELPPKARELAELWPAGAYEAVCEAFRSYWRGESGAKACKLDWTATLAKWVIGDHGKVMRGARGGVSYAKAVTASPAGRPARQSTVQPVAEQASEDGQDKALRARLADRITGTIFEEYLQPSAIQLGPDYIRIVTRNQFSQSYVEGNLTSRIARVAQQLGFGRLLVRVDVTAGASR